MNKKRIIKPIIAISLFIGVAILFLTTCNKEEKLSQETLQQAYEINNVIYKTCQILSGINNHQSAIDSLEQLYKECNTLEDYAKNHYYSPETQLAQLDKLKKYRDICFKSETLLLKEVARLEALQYYDCENLRHVIYSYYVRPSRRTGNFIPLFLPYSNLMVISDYIEDYSIATYLAYITDSPDFDIVFFHSSLWDKLKFYYYQFKNNKVLEALKSYTLHYSNNSENFKNAHKIYNRYVDVAMNDPLHNLVDDTDNQTLKGMVFPHDKNIFIIYMPATMFHYTEDDKNLKSSEIFEENLLHILPTLHKEYYENKNVTIDREKKKIRIVHSPSFLIKLQPPCKSTYFEIYYEASNGEIIAYNYFNQDDQINNSPHSKNKAK